MKRNLNLIAFIFTFLLFAWDMEHTHNFLSWIYLLIAIINIVIFIITVTSDLMFERLENYFKHGKDT